MEDGETQEGGGVKRIHLIISGDVQEVGYRMWVLRRAQDLRLVGWVKNREDGMVEVVAEGPKKQLEKLTDACKRGPDIAWVEKVDAVWEDAINELESFNVVY